MRVRFRLGSGALALGLGWGVAACSPTCCEREVCCSPCVADAPVACIPPKYALFDVDASGWLENPYSIATTDGNVVYATSYATQGNPGCSADIVRIDLEKKVACTLQRPSKPLKSRVLVALSPTGEIYVSDPGNNRVVAYKSEKDAAPGELVCPAEWAQTDANPRPNVAGPYGVAVDASGVLYVTRYTEHSATVSSGVYRRENGDWKLVLELKGTQATWLAAGADGSGTPLLAFNEVGAGTQESRVRVIDAHTGQTRYVTTPMPGAGENPGGIALGSTGDVFLVNQPVGHDLEWARSGCADPRRVESSEGMVEGFPIGVAMAHGTQTLVVVSGHAASGASPEVCSQIFVLKPTR